MENQGSTKKGNACILQGSAWLCDVLTSDICENLFAENRVERCVFTMARLDSCGNFSSVLQNF